MYIPRRYEEKDLETVHAFIRENSFAILVSVLDGVPVATHIPLLLEKDGEGRDVLVGHIARGNGQKGSFAGGGVGEGGAKVLAIFPGPHAYVSPRWYTQMNVPTWNYMAVHVYGTLTVIEGEELRAALCGWSAIMSSICQSRSIWVRSERSGFLPRCGVSWGSGSW